MINTRAGSVGLALAILLSLVGLALAGLLLDHQAKAANGGEPIARKLCEMGPRFGDFDPTYSCEDTLAGTYGRFPWWTAAGSSIPMSLLGFMYFGAVFAWFLIVGRPSGSRRNWHWFAVLLTGGGALFAALLAWLTLRGQVICPLCALVYVATILLFGLTLLIWPRRRFLQVMAEPVGGVLRGPTPVRIVAPDYPPGRAFAAWVLMTVAIAAFGWLGYQGRFGSMAAASPQGASGVGGFDESVRVEQSRREAELIQAAQAALEEAQRQQVVLAEELKSAHAEVLASTRPARELSGLRTELEEARKAVHAAQEQQSVLARELEMIRPNAGQSTRPATAPGR